MEHILVDTGVWFGLFDKKDQWHEKALQLADYLTVDYVRLILPWPTVYETLCTRFTRNSAGLCLFEEFLTTHRNTFFIEDNSYIEAALALSFESSLRKQRPISMTDCVIRLILDDPNVKTDYLATFNETDFCDVCTWNNVAFL